MSKDTQKQTIKFLRTLIAVRNLPLMALGLTTLAMVWPMSLAWAQSHFGGILAYIVANFLTIIFYGSVDGLLEVTLKFLDGTELPSKGRRLFYALIVILSLGALTASGTFSIWAAPAIAQALGGDPSEIGKDTKELLKQEYELQREGIKAQREAMRESAATREQRIALARAEADRLEAEAAASTSHGSWKRDYRTAKNQPNHWFWTCKQGSGCPANYIEYRESILAARAEGKRLIAQAGGSPTLAGAPAGGGSLAILERLSVADSTSATMALQLQAVRTKALVMAEGICLVLVAVITFIVLLGRKAYEIDDLGIEPRTLFSALGALFAKLAEVAGELWEEMLNAINPGTIRAWAALPFVWAGQNIGAKGREYRRQLEEKAKTAEAAAKAAEADRQKAEEARRQLEEARRQEAERARQEQYREELRRQQAEQARQEAERARQEAERKATAAAAELEAQKKQAETERQAAAAAAKIEAERDNLRRQQQEEAARQAADNLRRQKEEVRRQKELSEQTKRANPLSDAPPSLKLVGDRIIYTEGEKVVYYDRQKDLSALLDLTRKWYIRQNDSARPTARQQNADRYKAAKGFLSAHFGATFKEGAKVEISIPH